AAGQRQNMGPEGFMFFCVPRGSDNMEPVDWIKMSNRAIRAGIRAIPGPVRAITLPIRAIPPEFVQSHPHFVQSPAIHATR
ncbi:hypothetical protein, partial [Siminovitchia fortis]|uniref:hypothetical protein n=1 Tax=Siminovitchia fortis TaxID=254758 RepID=UPI000ED9AD79